MWCFPRSGSGALPAGEGGGGKPAELQLQDMTNGQYGTYAPPPPPVHAANVAQPAAANAFSFGTRGQLAAASSEAAPDMGRVSSGSQVSAGDSNAS